MDNFMDKLAKRFNAGELIQANGEAEARENQRLREQAEEYDKIMQEVRRLNLKTIEVSEQVSQMIACGIEQMEAYEGKEDGNDLQNYKLENIEAQLRALSDELSVMSGNLAAFDNQDDFISLARKVDDVAGMTKKEITDSAYRLEEELKSLQQYIVQSMSQRDDQQDREAFAALSENISRQLLGQSESQQESAKQIKDMIVNLRLYMDEVQKHIEDYVHKEDVKVYRNVQAVVNEQLSNKTRDLSDQINRVETEMEKSSGNKNLILLAVLFSAASLAIQVLNMMGVL